MKFLAEEGTGTATTACSIHFKNKTLSVPENARLWHLVILLQHLPGRLCDFIGLGKQSLLSLDCLWRQIFRLLAICLLFSPGLILQQPVSVTDIWDQICLEFFLEVFQIFTSGGYFLTCLWVRSKKNPHFPPYPIWHTLRPTRLSLYFPSQQRGCNS